MERNDAYLEEKMYEIWENHFSDVPRKNLVLIKFGKYSRRQLGAIKWANERTKIKGRLRKKKDEMDIADDKRISVIMITRYFQYPIIPEHVIEATIAHELVHYTHGFHSPLPKIANHPHRGRVVEKELIKRGMGEIYKESQKWIKENWREIVIPRSQRRTFGFFKI